VVEAKSQEVLNYSYSRQLETMKLINDYRVSVGFKYFKKKINHISFQVREEHDEYMIANNVVNHNDFVARSKYNKLWVLKVGEI
jgi:hypothetical protein